MKTVRVCFLFLRFRGVFDKSRYILHRGTEPFTMRHGLRWLPGIGLEGGGGRRYSIFRGWPWWGSPFEFFVSIAYQKEEGKR